MQTLFRPLRAGLVLLCTLLGLAWAAGAQAQSDYTKTKYPVVLVHGLLGFNSIAGIDYFYGLPAALKSGGSKVFVASVSQVNSSELRGEQLIAELEHLRAVTGATKFNLIGHSHGGPTTRYVAAVRPDLVASVTTTHGANSGSKVADGVKAITDATGSTGLAANLVAALGKLIGFLSGTSNPQDSLASLGSLTSSGAAVFNRRYPQGAPAGGCGDGAEVVGGVRYYSFGGTSVLTNILDPLDGPLGVTALFFGFENNDGLVSRCSQRWGKVLRDNYAWNHVDAINHSFGLRGLFSSDPNSVYRGHVNRLKNLGI